MLALCIGVGTTSVLALVMNSLEFEQAYFEYIGQLDNGKLWGYKLSSNSSSSPGCMALGKLQDMAELLLSGTLLRALHRLLLGESWRFLM